MSPNGRQPVIVALTVETGHTVKIWKCYSWLSWVSSLLISQITPSFIIWASEKTTRALSWKIWWFLSTGTFKASLLLWGARPVYNLGNKLYAQYLAEGETGQVMCTIIGSGEKQENHKTENTRPCLRRCQCIVVSASSSVHCHQIIWPVSYLTSGWGGAALG